MKPAHKLILTILKRHLPHGAYGLQIIKDSKGQLGMGIVFARLYELETQGLVFSEIVNGQGSRRAYSLTAAGEKALAEINLKNGETK